MQIFNNIIIAGSKGRSIAIDLYYLKNAMPKPVVVFVHGFKGFKDWGHFNLMAQRFARNGFVFIKFNFSHNGTTLENPTEFEDLEAFGQNNYIFELNDLESVINWIQSSEILKNEIDPDNLNLIGHSRGGGISIIKASEDKRVKKLVTWAAVSNFTDRNKESTIDEWKREGVLYAFNSRTKQDMPLYYQFYETIQNNRERLNIVNAAKKLTIPFLIIHGTNDEAVRMSDARELHESCPNSEIHIIEGAGHTFGVGHPFKANEFPMHAENAISKTIEFFNK